MKVIIFFLLLFVGSASAKPCETLTETTPRGIACFHCLHLNAKPQVDLLFKALHETCLKNLAISYLVDGSFSDASGLKDQIAELSKGGRSVLVQLYLLNGPSQRRFKETPLIGIGTKIEPRAFRKEVKENGRIVQVFKSKVSEISKQLNGLSTANVRLQIVPMLEDNLDDESYKILREIIKSTIPVEINYTIGRNPCPKCYLGNTRNVFEGDFLEVHTIKPEEVPQNGSISNDGEDISFDGKEGSVLLTSLLQLKSEAQKKNTALFIWNAEYQGLSVTQGKIGGNSVSANERDYKIPTDEEMRILIKFLSDEKSPR